jgi:hypothetical protein
MARRDGPSPIFFTNGAHLDLYRQAIEAAFHIARGIGGRIVESFPAFARNDV